MEVVCIAGLPGSGKSYLAQMYAQKGYKVLDDEARDKLVFLNLNCKYNLCIVDTYFCLQNVRDYAQEVISKVLPDHEIRWIFFENDPEQCRKNVLRRALQGDFRDVSSTLRLFPKLYKIPEGAITLPVWKESC